MVAMPEPFHETAEQVMGKKNRGVGKGGFRLKAEGRRGPAIGDSADADSVETKSEGFVFDRFSEQHG